MTDVTQESKALMGSYGNSNESCCSNPYLQVQSPINWWDYRWLNTIDRFGRSSPALGMMKFGFILFLIDGHDSYQELQNHYHILYPVWVIAFLKCENTSNFIGHCKCKIKSRYYNNVKFSLEIDCILCYFGNSWGCNFFGLL